MLPRKYSLLFQLPFVLVAAAATASPALASNLFVYMAGYANVVGGSSSAPGFSNSSWQANSATSSGKSEIYLPPALLFGHDINVADIASISYWTDKPGASTSPDWSFYIYTAHTASGNAASWYHSRLTSEPYLTDTPSSSDLPNTWNEWASDSANPMRFYDVFLDAGGVYGTFTDPTLADLQDPSFTWAGTTHTPGYGAQQVLYLSMQTGTPWANGFTGLMDGLTVTLTNGEIGTVNFEAVPEPSTIVLMSFGAIAILTAMRRRAMSIPR